ncbi:integral membrane protein [Rutstroemia sp. NJR-2017a BBW]|nr:integral membrane protein [Rutstroemia sp. NJR-2017a BBW]
MSSITSTSATVTYPTSIPTGTISALIGQPPNTTDDYYIVNYLLIAFGKHTSPLKGIAIPPFKPDNYVYTPLGPSILVGMSVAIAVMALVTISRLIVRFCGRGLVFGLDDLFIVPGALLAITWPSLQIMAVIYGGAGKHMWDVTYEEYGYFKRYTNLSKVVFFVSVGIVKVSICFFNRRLTSMTSKTWLWFNNIFLVLLFVYIMVSLFWDIFSCSPAYAGWDPIRIGRENIKPKCFSVSILGTILSTIHVVMDFGLLAVPLIVLWKVKMGWKTKSRLYFVFSIGMMSAVGSIFRQIEQGKLSSDVLYTFKPLEDWTLVDLTLGVVAASLPVLSAIIPARWRSIHSTSHKTPSHGGSYPLSRIGRRTSISGKRAVTDSEENIVRTDVVELSWVRRDDMSPGQGSARDGDGDMKRDPHSRSESMSGVGRVKRSFSRTRGAVGLGSKRGEERESEDEGNDPGKWSGAAAGGKGGSNGYTVEIKGDET